MIFMMRLWGLKNASEFFLPIPSVGDTSFPVRNFFTSVVRISPHWIQKFKESKLALALQIYIA